MNAKEHARVWLAAKKSLEILLDRGLKESKPEPVLIARLAVFELSTAVADAYKKESEGAFSEIRPDRGNACNIASDKSPERVSESS